MDIVLDTAMLFVILMLVSIGGLFLFRFLKYHIQGYPYEKEIESFLLPYVYEAILVGFKGSEMAAKEFGKYLEGVDRKKLADTMYDLLPDKITFKGITIPIRKAVSQEQFAELVEDVYGDFLKFYKNNEDKFREEIEKLINSPS